MNGGSQFLLGDDGGDCAALGDAKGRTTAVFGRGPSPPAEGPPTPVVGWGAAFADGAALADGATRGGAEAESLGLGSGTVGAGSTGATACELGASPERMASTATTTPT